MDNESRGILKCEHEGKKLKKFIENKHLREEEVIMVSNRTLFRSGVTPLISIESVISPAATNVEIMY